MIEINIYGDSYINSKNHNFSIIHIINKIKDMNDKSITKLHFIQQDSLLLTRIVKYSDVYYIAIWDIHITNRARKLIEYQIKISEQELKDFDNLMALFKLNPNQIDKYIVTNRSNNFLYTDLVRNIKELQI